MFVYEAWRVKDGRTGNSNFDDQFSCAFIENTGTLEYNTEVFWVDENDNLFEEVSKWGQDEVVMARNLQATYDFPGIELINPVFRRKFTYDNRNMV